ncbi:MAG TPA: response regulator transcription factor [Nocardioides sp.]
MTSTEPTATIRVLIADDHAVVRSGLAQLLATADDLELVGSARDGDEAIEETARLGPDVVVMDLSMPGTDGIEATRRIVQDNPGVQVLVLTSFSDRTRILGALDAGAIGYLLKHAEADTILSGIRDVARGGSPLDPTAARILLSGRGSPPGAAPQLTVREREVLLMVRDGLPNKSIARRLGISERTVKAHLTHIFQRLGLSDRTQAAIWAERHLEAETD